MAYAMVYHSIGESEASSSLWYGRCGSLWPSISRGFMGSEGMRLPRRSTLSK